MARDTDHGRFRRPAAWPAPEPPQIVFSRSAGSSLHKRITKNSAAVLSPPLSLFALLSDATFLTDAGSVLEAQSVRLQASVFPVGTLVPLPALWHFNGAGIGLPQRSCKAEARYVAKVLPYTTGPPIRYGQGAFYFGAKNGRLASPAFPSRRYWSVGVRISTLYADCHGP